MYSLGPTQTQKKVSTRVQTDRHKQVSVCYICGLSVLYSRLIKKSNDGSVQIKCATKQILVQ